MKDVRISLRAALAIEGLHELGVDEDLLCEITGLRGVDMAALLDGSREIAEFEHGRTLALMTENVRLLRRVRTLEKTIKKAGLELPSEYQVLI